MVTREQTIEIDLIEKLKDLKYAYRPDITTRSGIESNFRQKFNQLNNVTLSDTEFKRLLDQIISPDVYEASRHLREINTLERDDGTPLNYTLVNIKDWCKNTFEVINQLRINTDYSHHRYDVLLLINGVPVVQIELKSLAISPRRAMQQIVDYKNDAGCGYGKALLCFVQMFIVSNQTDTWYFANNNSRHFSFDADERFLPIYQYADKSNKKITHLADFASHFLPKCTLGEMISRYMVLVASEQKLMIMRPYQIYAVKAIVDCIHQNSGNGYIWHTTGSGKTLTSFKASTLLKDNPDIEKCLFVVDRKDLDRQTREEFNKFQEGCVEENTNTGSLVQRLLSTDHANKVIVTTIQKLGLALDPSQKSNYKQQLERLSNSRVVFIFDECHRSQFGENHKAIKEFFPKAQLFGFTGTPIFETNASYKQVENQAATYRTTEDVFQNLLHAYTITHAIEDRNVLRFHVDYFRPEGATPPSGESFTKRAIIEAILHKHDSATSHRKFNSVLATASINDAIAYYQLFKTLQAERQSADLEFQPLNITCVFSPPANGNSDVNQLQEDLPQEKEDNKKDPEGKKAALTEIINDYNARYGCNFNINDFDNYYKDIQKRIKNQQYPNRDVPHEQKIDIIIVVDMLLTGFDSKFLNTLYVDKNLKYHGLIQAFSRTNRVLNDSKPYGNILDFRQQEEAVNEAITLFSGEQAASTAREIWLVDPAPVVIDKLQVAVSRLQDFMESHDLEFAPEQVANLKGDAARAEFVNIFKEVQRLQTQLDQYTDLTDEQEQIIVDIFPTDTLKGFRGMYLETAKRLKDIQEKEGDNALTEIQQLDFEFVLFSSAIIDYDYIMDIVTRYSNQPLEKREMTREQLLQQLSITIQSDARFLDEREELTSYISTLPTDVPLMKEAVCEGYNTFKKDKLAAEVSEIAGQHGLPADQLQEFVSWIIQRMIFDGDKLSQLMSPLELGWKDRARKEVELMKDLVPVLHKLAQGREISGLAPYEH